MGQLLANMDLLKLASVGLFLVLVGLSSGASSDGDCSSILEQSQLLSTKYPNRIAHGIHSLTLADLRRYFNPNANLTNNVPTINRNLSSSSEPILNDAPDIGRSDRFQTMGLLVAEEVVLNEDRDWDMHNADVLGKLMHALHMHEVWAATSKVYQSLLANPPADPNFCPCLADVENNGVYFNLRNIAILIREPNLAYNTDNKRVPRGGRALQNDYTNGHVSYINGNVGGRQHALIQKRAAEEEGEPIVENDSEFTYRSKTGWVDLFNGYAKMTEPVKTDLALFLYCMLN